ncbi:hypothetical protein L1049_008970 [Liquidambar formosana]|uniref:NB-ARC domain-containing protein n=1 Tax=Liquidambar formosana TaxID=63359 RepID=A0AAP0SA92_LIQFO
MEIVIAVVAKISEYLVEPVVRPAGYLIYYNRNVSTLNSQVEELGHARSRLQHRVEAARWNGELIHDDVHSWLTKVNEINGQVETFQNEVKENKGCLGGWCQNPISRYSLSRKAKKRTEVVNELHAKGISFSSVSYPPLPSGMVTTDVKGFADFQSRKSIMKDIMAALKDDNIHSIGICGLGGVGKTTTAKEVGNRAKVEKLFDATAMAVVSQTQDITKIQDAIANMLGLQLKSWESSCEERANRLRARLMDGTRNLVILDDVWARLDLDAVGIPIGDDCKGCRVMITSRNEQVCKFMKTCKNFTMGVLSDPEAWSLFKEMAGNSIESDPQLKPIAEDVVKECGGLPIAIVTVGRALESEEKHTWEDARRELKMPRPGNIPEMLEDVYQSLKWSYDSLKTQDAKSFLLVCSMFPEDADIRVEDLVIYGMGLGLFKDIDALAEARNRVKRLVDQLKRCFLLLDGEWEDYVSMHDVVHDVIRYIATTEGADKQYAVIPPPKSSIEIHELPDRLDCPKLELLRVGNGSKDLKIPGNHLFKEMKELRVLCTRRVAFIPTSSLSFLTKLRTLALQDCGLLENISVIGEMQELRTLSLKNSSIEELPQEMGKLMHLRLLDLTGCHLKIVSLGVISSLFRLEELYLEYSGLRWVVEGEGKEKNEVNLAELLSLSNLIALESHLPTVKFPPSINILFEKLERFQISICPYEIKWREEFQLQLELDTKISVDSGIEVLLKKIETLHLQLKGMKNVLNDLTRESLEQLKSLKLEYCEGLEYLIDTVDLDLHSICFPLLESLKIISVQNLKMICDGQLSEGSFGKLRYIEVGRCDMLENLFSQSIARGLVQLEVLKIGRCKMIDEIVATESGEHVEATNKIRFPKLRELTFENLPSIIGFCKKIDEIEFPQLSTLYLRDLPKLKSLCANSLASKGNHGIATQHLFNEKVMSLCELRSMEVYSCNNLLNVFSSNLVQSLQNLDQLEVENCDSLELVFDFVGINIEEGRATSVLTCLKNLKLVCLPKLTRLWKNAPPQIQGFQSLLSVEVGDCPSLKNIFTPSIARLLVKLEELQVSNCAIMEIVGKDEEDGEENEDVTKLIVFPQLNSLRLENLPDLVSFGPESYTFEWPALKELSFNNVNMKVFIPVFLGAQKQRTIDAKSHQEQQIKFPNLEVLRLAGEEWIRDCQLQEELTIEKCENSKAIDVGSGEILPQVNLHTHIHHLFNEKVAFPSLKDLSLDGMNKLNEIWCEMDHKGIRGFQNLKSLRVFCCGSLRDVFNPSMARGLLHLERLHIGYCEMMEEIVVKGENEKEDGMDTIKIPQLKRLELYGLPNLTSFCQGLYAFDLPLLENVIINDCPKMKTFSFGSLSTPMLQRVQEIFLGKSCWMDNLNNTVQQLFKRKKLEENQEIEPHEQLVVEDEET